MNASTSPECLTDQEHNGYSDGEDGMPRFDVQDFSAVDTIFESLLSQFTQKGLVKCVRLWVSAFDSLSGHQDLAKISCWPGPMAWPKDLNKVLKRDLAQACAKMLLQHENTPAHRRKLSCSWTKALRDATSGFITSEALYRGPTGGKHDAVVKRINHNVLPRLFRMSQDYEDCVKQKYALSCEGTTHQSSVQTSTGAQKKVSALTSSITRDGFLRFGTDPTVMAGDFWAGEMPTLRTFFKQKFLLLGAKPLRAVISRWVQTMRSLMNVVHTYHHRLPRESPTTSSPSWWPQEIPHSPPSLLKLEELAVLGVEILLLHRNAPVDEAKRQSNWTYRLKLATNIIPEMEDQINLVLPDVIRLAQQYEDCVKEHKLWIYEEPHLFPPDAIIRSARSHNVMVSAKRKRQPSAQPQSQHSDGGHEQAPEPKKRKNGARESGVLHRSVPEQQLTTSSRSGLGGTSTDNLANNLTWQHSTTTYGSDHSAAEVNSSTSNTPDDQSNDEVLKDSHTEQRMEELEMSLAVMRQEQSLLREHVYRLDRQLNQDIGICDNPVTRDLISGNITCRDESTFQGTAPITNTPRLDPSLVPTQQSFNLGLASFDCPTGSDSALQGQSVSGHSQHDHVQCNSSFTWSDTIHGAFNNMDGSKSQMDEHDNSMLKRTRDQLQYSTGNPTPTHTSGHTSTHVPDHAKDVACPSTFSRSMMSWEIDGGGHQKFSMTPMRGQLASQEVGTSSSHGMRVGALEGAPWQSSGSEGAYHAVSSANSELRNGW